MSDLRAPYGEYERDRRRRALWGLLVLALSAALVVAVTVFLVGGSGDGKRIRGLGKTGAPAPSGSPGSASQSRNPPRVTRSSSRSTHPETTHPAPTSTANPCPSAAPCAVSGDKGQVAAALNNYRISHGRSRVSGAVSPQAQQCALRQGSGPTCVPHYAFQPVPAQDGARVISMVAGRGDGSQWLLDPGMTSFSVGWAYTPGPGGGPGQYQCAILKVG